MQQQHSSRSRSSSFEYLAMSLSEAVRCLTRVNRLFGDDILFVSAPKFTVTDTYHLGGSCASFCPPLCPKGAKTYTTEEGAGKKSKNIWPRLISALCFLIPCIRAIYAHSYSCERPHMASGYTIGGLLYTDFDVAWKRLIKVDYTLKPFPTGCEMRMF